jgi:outer membrane lipase/esterase
MKFQKRLIAAALALSACASAQAFEFTNVYILGDSLSDAGQYGARFTTNPGLTASEYLAQRYGFTVKPSTQGGTDYAYGGARVTTQGTYNPQATPVAGQVTALISAAGGHLDPNALYFIQGGPNDIFFHAALAGAGAESSTAAQTAVGQAATDFLTQLARLHAAGAQYIMVENLPDIGRTPAERTSLYAIRRRFDAAGAESDAASPLDVVEDAETRFGSYRRLAMASDFRFQHPQKRPS